MGEFLSLSEASRRLGLPPRTLSTAVYTGRVHASELPTIAGRHVIPAEMLPVLRERLTGGRLPRVQS